MGAIENSFAVLKKEGSLESQIGNMQTRHRLYEVIKYQEYNQFDESLHNFKLKT